MERLGKQPWWEQCACVCACKAEHVGAHKSSVLVCARARLNMHECMWPGLQVYQLSPLLLVEDPLGALL